MEKYEINKFINEYQVKLNDLKIALNIDNKKPRLEELEKKTLMDNFWLDQTAAQTIIYEVNQLKDIITSFDRLNSKFNDILDMTELIDDDVEAMELFETMINEFINEEVLLEQNALLSGKYDYSNCILELHPGAGGTESMDWADMLYRMYLRFCDKKGYKVKVLDYLPGDIAGIKSVILSITGPYAYGLLKGEKGVHRLVRISPFDSNSRRHTSFCSCDVAPEISNNNEIVIKDEDIRVDVFRSSGAGGQSVNTTDSAVRITHLPTNIVVTCQNERSQIKNKEVALNVLKSKLLELEIKRQDAELKAIKGENMNINFGSQIRSYVFCPYTLVKDHRTDYEVGNVNSVMDGDIEGFMISYLKMMAGKNNE